MTPFEGSFEILKKKWGQDPSTIWMLSSDRKYTYDESAYSAEPLDSSEKSPGAQVVALFLKHGPQTGTSSLGPALELGCGHGFVSGGLVRHSIFPEVIISDASMAFVELCRKNIEREVPNPKALRYAILNCKELDALPDNTFSLITLANTLHHLVGFREVIAKIKTKLHPKGVFVFQEPLGNGMILLGLMLQTLFEARGYHKQSFVRRLQIKLFGAGKNYFSVEDSVKVSNFAQFVAEVNRRDTYKEQLEDKNMFSADEFFQMGVEEGFQVHAYLNRSLGNVFESQQGPHPFRDFCRGYFVHCLGWNSALQEKVLRLLDPQIEYLETLSRGREVPPSNGVFCFVKN